jgi:hypothetical protein
MMCPLPLSFGVSYGSKNWSCDGKDYFGYCPNKYNESGPKYCDRYTSWECNLDLCKECA